MANGPLGGFMPTPAAPAQPPQVKLEATADSRGNFNNFLKNMNGAMSLNPPSMAPAMGAMAPNMAPALSNIDIFDQPVSMMQQGGNVPPRNTNIMGQPHMLAYITPQEGQLLENLGGANQPGPMGIPSFFDVGEGMGGFGSEDSAVSGGSDPSDNDESIVGDDPVAGIDFNEDTGSFDVVSTPTVTEQEQQQNIAESKQFVDTPSIPNVTFNNQTILNATRNLPEGNEAQRAFKDDIVNTLQNYAKDNDLAGALNQYQIETVSSGDKRGENIVNSIIQASNVNPAAYSAAVFNPGILSLDDKKITDLAKTPDSLTDTGLRGSLTPGASQNVIDTAKNAIRASAGNNQAIDNIVAQFGGLDPSIGELASRTKSGIGEIGQIRPGDVEDLSGTPTTLPPPEFVFDYMPGNLGGTELTREQRVQNLLDRGRAALEAKKQPEKADRDAAALALGIGTPPIDQTNLQSRTALGGRGQSGTTTTTTLPEDYEENVGLPFSDKRMGDIERLLNLPEGQTRTGEGRDPAQFARLNLPMPSLITSLADKLEKRYRDELATDVALGRARGLGEILSGFTAPSMFVDNQGRALVSDSKGNLVPSSTVKPETFTQFTNRLQRNIADESGETKDFTSKQIPESRLIRDNIGRITAITDPFGRTITGVNPDEFFGPEENDPTPIIRPLRPKPEEPKPDLPPNVIGGTALTEIPQLPTVVESPFTTSTAGSTPIIFDVGDLNRLIEQLTGVAAKPVVAKQEGGLVSAVDEFLASAS
jgi:hypothetical protein